MTTTAPPTAAERYLQAVRRHLHGLPDEEREELLDDLRSHLAEVSSEDQRPLEEVLGPPDAFAAELLASAGVAAPPDGGDRSRAFDQARRGLASAQAHPWTTAVRRFLPELRPAWWVLRGYLWVVVLSLVTDGGVHTLPFPQVFGTVVVGVPLAVAAAVASVRLGRRPHPPRWVPALDAATAVAALFLVVAVQDRAMPTYVYYGPSASPAGTLVGSDGDPITNIYPYDADGRLLDHVLLYDQDGDPVDVGDDAYDDDTGYPIEVEPRLDANGAEIDHAYPLRQRRPVVGPDGRVRSSEIAPPPAVVVPRAVAPPAVTPPATVPPTTTAPPSAAPPSTSPQATAGTTPEGTPPEGPAPAAGAPPG